MFLIGTFFALAPPLNELINALCKDKVESLNEVVSSFLKVAQGTPKIISIILFGATLSLSYVLGFLCYRQELKKLNNISFEKISKNKEDSIKKEWEDYLKKEYEKSKVDYIKKGYNELSVANFS